MKIDKKVKEVMESKKEMEMKVKAAMEQTKFLDLDSNRGVMGGNILWKQA
jgi:hypothetical protein